MQPATSGVCIERAVCQILPPTFEVQPYQLQQDTACRYVPMRGAFVRIKVRIAEGEAKTAPPLTSLTLCVLEEV